MVETKTNQVKGSIFKEIKYLYFIRFIVLMISLITFQNFVSAQKLNLELKFSSNQRCFLESSATVADIDNNGTDEAVIAAQEELIAVGKTGNSIWRWKAKGRFMTYPAILKRAGNVALIYAADYGGKLNCLDGNGKVVWQADLNAGSEWSASVVADLDGNGTYEVIQTDIKGTVWVFDALTGSVLKKTSIVGIPVSPAVGDLNGDGKSEIAVATNDGTITVLGNDLTERWKYKTGGFSESWSTSAPVLFSASDGKNYLVAASSTGDIYCFDAQGKPAWHYPTNVPVSSSISAGDFDQDGQSDIFIITQTGLVYRFDEKGNVIWKIDMQGRGLASGAIADINNDGKLEYILSTQTGHFLVLNQSGDVVFDYQLPSRSINVTPSIGSITGNPDKLDLFLTGGESGQTYCFESPATKKSVIQWSNYRGNAQNTGSWFGLTKSDELRMVPQNLAWNKLLNGDRIQFNISNPKPGSKPLKAAAICISPDGAKNNAIANIYGKEGQLLLPVDFTLPGNYQFSWSLTNSDGKELLSGSREISVQAFENDRALAKHSVSELNSAADQVEPVLPLSAIALRNEADQIQAKVNAISAQQEMVAVSNASAVQTTIKNTAKLNDQAKRAILISDLIGKAAKLGTGTSLIAFEGSKWENRNVDKQLPAKVENPVLISHAAVPGEHQPVPLMLFNVTDHLLNVRIVSENPDKEIKVTAMRSINTSTSLGEESWDALPVIDESGVISIPSLSSREVWLDIDINQAKPGKHDIDVTLQALNGAGILDAPTNPHAVPAPETKVKISLNVLPFQMAPSGEFRLCTWSPSSGPELEGLLAHGNNIFLLPQPILKFNSENQVTGIDYTALDQVTAQFKGKDIFFLISGQPAIKDEFASEGYKKQFSFYLKDLVSHLATNGIGTDRFAMYPIDEPGGAGWNAINTLVKIGEMAAAINPDVMLYEDGGGELPMFQAMSKYVDIWSPSIDWIGDQNQVMDIMRTKGKLWSYNCSYASSRPVGPNIKNINITYEYRIAALMALRNGSSGIGFWCYNSVSENPWSRIKLEYNLVYPGTNQSITSRRWEAVREGIEDYRILAALQAYLKPEAKTDETIRQKIDHLINVSLPNLVDPGYQAMKLGQSREVFDLVCSDAKMDEFRTEMILCIQSITDANTKNWAEKLGFEKGKKVLLLHIDDAGMCPEANVATQNYLEKGDLTSAAVMMPCINAKAMIEWAKSHPKTDIGMHLTLTAEWQDYRWGSVADPKKVASLIDPDGKFYHEVPDVVMHASAKDVETEIRAQIDKSIALGHQPTHIDTHMGTLYGCVDYINVFMKVAQEYHLPANIIDVSDPQVAEQFRKAGYPITDEVIRSVAKYNLPKLDNFTSVGEGATYEEKRDNFFKLVKSLNSGLTEIIFHPATLSDNLKSITGTWQQRVWEGELFSDPVVKQFFIDEGIVITNWIEIMKRFDGKK